MSNRPARAVLGAALAASLLVATACGGDDSDPDDASETSSSSGSETGSTDAGGTDPGDDSPWLSDTLDLPLDPAPTAAGQAVARLGFVIGSGVAGTPSEGGSDAEAPCSYFEFDGGARIALELDDDSGNDAAVFASQGGAPGGPVQTLTLRVGFDAQSNAASAFLKESNRGRNEELDGSDRVLITFEGLQPVGADDPCSGEIDQEFVVTGIEPAD